MLNSKNLVTKLLLTVSMLSGFSLYCAQAGTYLANTSANTAAEYFKALTAAQEAYDAIPLNASKSLEEELPAFKGSLQNFAQAYLAAKGEAVASGKQDVLDLLDTMATDDLETKQIVQALKARLNLSNSIGLIKFLANPSANLGLVGNKDQAILTIFGVTASTAPVAPALSAAELASINQALNESGYIGYFKNVLQNPNEQIEGGRTLMSFNAHAEGGQEKGLNAIKALIKLGANVNLADNSGNTPLFYAAYYGNKDIVDFILANGADKSLKNHSGQTARVWGAERGQANNANPSADYTAIIAVLS